MNYILLQRQKPVSVLKEEIAPWTRLDRRDFYSFDTKNPVYLE